MLMEERARATPALQAAFLSVLGGIGRVIEAVQRMAEAGEFEELQARMNDAVECMWRPMNLSQADAPLPETDGDAIDDGSVFEDDDEEETGPDGATVVPVPVNAVASTPALAPQPAPAGPFPPQADIASTALPPPTAASLPSVAAPTATVLPVPMGNPGFAAPPVATAPGPAIQTPTPQNSASAPAPPPSSAPTTTLLPEEVARFRRLARSSAETPVNLTTKTERSMKIAERGEHLVPGDPFFCTRCAGDPTFGAYDGCIRVRRNVAAGAALRYNACANCTFRGLSCI